MPPPQRVHLDFTGCRLNQAEIEQMARQFAAQGHDITPDAADADLVVINTCAVTKQAARKSRRLIRQVGRANPTARIAATGCYAALEPDAVAALPGVAHVVGNDGKDSLPQHLTGDVPAYDREPVLRDPLPPGTLGRTRAFVKVQDGCDNRCTFCVTTLARGASRSRPAAEIVDEVNLLSALGYREAVLTGVHLGAYGRDAGQTDGLPALVRRLLAETSIPRIRLSSLEPWDIPDGFFALWADPRLCPHLHLPLQSGSDATLRRMARRTTRAAFASLADTARAHIPGLLLTTDVIAGFPGETDVDFEDTLRYVERTGFARLHVFTYSARPGTAAAQMPGQVPLAVRQARHDALQALSDRLWEATQRAHLGRTVDVLWESARGAGPDGFVWAGHTGSYLRVFATSPRPLGNTITRARLTGLSAEGLLAEIA